MFCYDLGQRIATKVWTCYDSTAVMACAQFHSDLFVRICIEVHLTSQQLELWTNIACEITHTGQTMGRVAILLHMNSWKVKNQSLKLAEPFKTDGLWKWGYTFSSHTHFTLFCFFM